MGDMHGRAEIAVERLRLSERECVIDRCKARCRIALCNEGEDRGGLRQDASVGDQGRDAALRIEGEIMRLALFAVGEIDTDGFVVGASLLERDVRRERTGARRV
jgi:hypothetical protein